VPVVDVQDIRHPVIAQEHLQDGAAKELVPQQVVGVAVDIRPAEVAVVEDEVHGHALGPPHGRDIDGAVAVRERDDEGPAFGGSAVGLQGAGVAGHDHAHLVANLLEALRQRGGDISEASHLREGVNLGRRKHDLHAASSKRRRSSSARITPPAATRHDASRFTRAEASPNVTDLQE
jgi:hypothetical protein